MQCNAPSLQLTTRVLLLAVIGISGAPLRTNGAVNQSSRSQLEFADRLNIAELYVEGLDPPYNRELQRLDELCRNREHLQACRVANLRRTFVRVVSVHAGASDSSPILGELNAVLEFHPRYGLGYRLEFRPRGAPRKPAVWLDSVGDWGYGVEIPGVRIRGTWIQLFGSPLPATSWINGALLRADAGSIEGRLVTLPRLLAVWLDGTRRSIVPGSYLVERIRGSEVTVRAEVPTDFSCGEQVEAPVVIPPSVRIAAQDLFSRDGAAVFSETYGRGC
jgi:hypothetical protein